MIALSESDVRGLSERELQIAAILAKRGYLAFDAEGSSAHWPMPEWEPQPKQREFLDCPAYEVLYGGAAGGGKTDALILFSLGRRHRYPGSKGLILRKKLTDIESAGALLDRMHELIPGQVKYNGRLHRFTFPCGGFIELGHCPRTWNEFRDRYQGMQIDDLCVDEAGQWEWRYLNYLRSRVRSTVWGCPTLIRYSSNPGGLGHAALKRRFVEPARAHGRGVIWTPNPTAEEPDPKDRAFIPARLADNTALMERDPGYRSNLEALPDVERRALLEGDWDVFLGQFFPEWDEGVHLCDPFDTPSGDPPANWRRIVGLDWGFNHPTVVLWGAIDPDGVVWLYREIWLRGKHIGGEDGIASRLRDYPDTPAQIAAGSDCFSFQKEYVGGPSVAEAFRNEGYLLQPVTVGRKRLHTWQQVRHYLKWRGAGEARIDGAPLLRIVRGRCPRLCAELPEMIFDENDSEDMVKRDIDPDTGEGGDDAVDALGHLLMARPFRTITQSVEYLPKNSLAALQKEKDKYKRLQKASGKFIAPKRSVYG